MSQTNNIVVTLRAGNIVTLSGGEHLRGVYTNSKGETNPQDGVVVSVGVNKNGTPYFRLEHSPKEDGRTISTLSGDEFDLELIPAGWDSIG